MSNVIGVTASTQIIDPRSGYLTRDGFLLFQTFVNAVNGTGASVTVDGIQTLSNKTVSGDLNTLSNIGTNSLKNRTGSDNQVVTGTAGGSGTIAQWDANGDVVGGPEVITLVTTTSAEDAYLSRDGSLEATGPVRLATFTVATVPDATVYTQGLIYVSDEAGGATVAFSDGTNWRRVQDRAVIS